MKSNAQEIKAIRQEINNDPDLNWIISRRSSVRFLGAFFPEANGSLKVLEGKDRVEKEKIEEKLKPILNKEIEYFIKSEWVRYQKKNNRDYLNDIKKARDEGNNSALINLLEWDQAWLKIDWVIDKILQAQDRIDFPFLKIVGEAIAKQPGSIIRPMKDIDLVPDIKHLFDILGVRRGDISIIKDLQNRLNAAGIIGDNKADFNYFVKWLSRHGII